MEELSRLKFFPDVTIGNRYEPTKKKRRFDVTPTGPLYRKPEWTKVHMWSSEQNRKRRLCQHPASAFPLFFAGSLPLDLVVYHLLPRLSLPQIFQLRCVCKSWYALLPIQFLTSPKALSEYLRRHEDESPWLVMVRFRIKPDLQHKEKSSSRELVAYIPSLNRWFRFPLPFPSILTVSDGVRHSIGDGGGADISSILGPAFQNTYADCGISFHYCTICPSITSAHGLICALIRNDSDENSETQGIPSEWASLLLFNPLTGKSRRVPLPSSNHCLLRHYPLSVSILQVKSTDDSNKCKYYVALCPYLYRLSPPFAILFMYVYDVQARFWRGPISHGPLENFGLFKNCCTRCALPTVHADVVLADGVNFDILRDADIICSIDSNSFFDSVESQLYGYSIEKNVWVKASVDITDSDALMPRYRYSIRRTNQYCTNPYSTVWRDSVNRRVFLAASFRPLAEGLVSPFIAAGQAPSTATGFDIWELKPVTKPSETEDSPRYYWHHLSRTPPKFWRHFYQEPQKLDEKDNDVFFITSGHLVCMTAVDYEDSKYFQGIEISSELKAQFPFGSYSRPIVYDILLDKWFQLPDPPPVEGSHYVQFPLFAFKTSLYDITKSD